MNFFVHHAPTGSPRTVQRCSVGLAPSRCGVAHQRDCSLEYAPDADTPIALGDALATAPTVPAAPFAELACWADDDTDVEPLAVLP